MMSMSVLVFLLTIFLGVCTMFIGFSGMVILSTRKHNLPKSYRIIHLSMFIGLLFFSILLSLRIGYDFSYEGEILAVLVLINVPFVIYICTNRINRRQKTLTLKNVFFKYRVTDEDLEFQKLTTKKFAEENNIEYIPNVIKKELYSADKKKKYVALDNEYILLYPYKSRNSVKIIEWYGINEKGKYFLILSNQKSFDGITNLDEILFQIIRLYSKYIDQDVFIDFSGFAIKLQDKVTKDYKGEASLVVTNELIQNDKIEFEDRYDAKRYYMQIFLTDFIGWNFGSYARRSTLVKIGLHDLKEKAANEGLI